MYLVGEIRNKDPDKILVPHGKIFQCLGRCFIMKVWDIRIIGVKRFLNTITSIFYQRLPNCEFIIQLKFIGKEMFQ